MESLETNIIKKYKAGDIVLKEGFINEEMFLLLKGRVEIFTVVNNEIIILDDLAEGSFLGETAIFEKLPLNYSVRAVEDSSVIIINESRFKNLFTNENTLAFKLMKNFSSRLRSYENNLRKINYIMQKNKEEHTVEACDQEQREDCCLEGSLYQELSIIPPGHKVYPISAKSDDSSFMYQKKIKCPLCDHVFEVQAVRNSRLILEKTDNDLRQRFKNFEPLWYLIWICPNCSYANLNSEFETLTMQEKLRVNETKAVIQENIAFSYSDPRLMDEVFKAYYITLFCSCGSLKMGKIWLRLAWLYDDAEDKEMLKYSQEQALRCYRDAYYKANNNSSIEKDQHLTYIIGELSLQLGDYEEAKKHFFKSVVNKRGSAFITRQARIRIDDLKALTNKR